MSIPPPRPQTLDFFRPAARGRALLTAAPTRYDRRNGFPTRVPLRTLMPRTGGQVVMAAGFPRLSFRWAAALLLLLAPGARANDWKFDVVVLKPGPGASDDNRALKGLLVGYKEGAEEVEIRVI